MLRKSSFRNVNTSKHVMFPWNEKSTAILTDNCFVFSQPPSVTFIFSLLSAAQGLLWLGSNTTSAE